MNTQSQDIRAVEEVSVVERQVAAFSTDAFLCAAGGSILLSLFFKIQGRHKDALFVGQWAPTFVLLGIVGKLARQLGATRQERRF